MALEAENGYTQRVLSIGAYLIERFIHHGLFQPQSKKGNDSKHAINYIILTTEVIIDITKGNNIREPYLSVEQIIFNNLNSLVHSNR